MFPSLQVAHAIASGLQSVNASIATDELLIITALRHAGCSDAPKGSLRPILERTAAALPAPGTTFSCYPTMAMYRSLYQGDTLPKVRAAPYGAEELACSQHPVLFADLRSHVWCKVGADACGLCAPPCLGVHA